MTIAFESKHTHKKNIAQFICVPIFITKHWFCSGFHHQNIFLLTLGPTCKTRETQMNVVSRCHFVIWLPFSTSWINLLCGSLAVEFRWVTFRHNESKVRNRSQVCLLPLWSLISTLESFCRHSPFIKRGKVGKTMNQGKAISITEK